MSTSQRPASAPTGQLVPIKDKLFYEAPTGARLEVKDDRATLLAQLLPLAYAGKLANAEARALQRQHDEVLQASASQFEQLAVKAIDNQQQTINGLVGVLDKLADQSVPIVEVHQFSMGDAAEKMAMAAFLTLLMALTALSVCTIGRFVIAGNSQPTPINYINR